MAERYQRTQETEERLRAASKKLQAEGSKAWVSVDIPDGGEVEPDARLLAGLYRHRQAVAEAIHGETKSATAGVNPIAAASLLPQSEPPQQVRRRWFGGRG